MSLADQIAAGFDAVRRAAVDELRWRWWSFGFSDAWKHIGRLAFLRAWNERSFLKYAAALGLVKP